MSVVLAGVVLVACSGGDAAPSVDSATTTDASTVTTDAAPTTDATTAPSTTTAPSSTTTTSAPTPSSVADPTDLPERPIGEWTSIAPGGECACADGSEFVFWDRPQDPERLVLFFQGGGACFDATTCAYSGGTYSSNVGGPPGNFGGLFDTDDPDNPVATFSTVYVPYCTGDLHLGATVADYDGLEVNHLGHVNAMAAIEHVLAAYPELDELFVTGISAGAIPSPFYAALLSERYPDTRITVLADGSGGYSRATALDGGIGSAWGTSAILPDWPSARNADATAWSIPGLFVRAAAHAPDLVLARFDYAYDGVQDFFRRITGAATDDLLAEIEDNDRWIRDESGRSFATYTAPGTGHTVLLSPALGALEVEGVRLMEWIAALLAGADVPDVRCEVCAS